MVIDTADKRLFRHISSKTKRLHHLLPPQRNVRTDSSLRTRGHNFTLPHTDVNLYKKKFFYQSLSVPVSLTLPPRQLPAPATSVLVCTTTQTSSKPLSYFLCYVFCALFTHLHVFIFHFILDYWTIAPCIVFYLYDCAFVTFIIKGYLT